MSGIEKAGAEISTLRSRPTFDILTVSYAALSGLSQTYRDLRLLSHNDQWRHDKTVIGASGLSVRPVSCVLARAAAH